MSRANPPNATDAWIAGAVRRRRAEAQVSQSTLAKALGLSYQQVQKYEGGQNRIPASRLVEIAAVLEIDAGLLLPPAPVGPAVETPEARDEIWAVRDLVETVLALPADQRAAVTRLARTLAKA